MNQEQILRTLAVEADLQEGVLSITEIAEKHGIKHSLIISLILEEMARKDGML